MQQTSITLRRFTRLYKLITDVSNPRGGRILVVFEKVPMSRRFGKERARQEAAKVAAARNYSIFDVCEELEDDNELIVETFVPIVRPGQPTSTRPAPFDATTPTTNPWQRNTVQGPPVATLRPAGFLITNPTHRYGTKRK